jgi:hypothetical protein
MTLHVRSVIRAVLLQFAIATSVAMGGSASPSTAPADSATVLKSALLKLSDRDPKARDAAREQLMAMSPADLPVLRAAVEQILPLPPGDAEALHEIVTHVYLVGDNLDGASNQGFMGILMADFTSAPTDDDVASDTPSGVIVEMRFPGFDSYRVLRDGDIILTISSGGMSALPVRSYGDIKNTVAKLSPGQQVKMEVIRSGRRIEVTVTLDARPSNLAAAQPAAMDPEEFRRTLIEKAEAFWTARFAPLIDQSIS